MSPTGVDDGADGGTDVGTDGGADSGCGGARVDGDTDPIVSDVDTALRDGRRRTGSVRSSSTDAADIEALGLAIPPGIVGGSVASAKSAGGRSFFCTSAAAA
jgi:hypothetical protein